MKTTKTTAMTMPRVFLSMNDNADDLHWFHFTSRINTHFQNVI